jgi:hypothetical protein
VVQAVGSLAARAGRSRGYVCQLMTSWAGVPASNEPKKTPLSPLGWPPSTCNRIVVHPVAEIEPRFCNGNVFTAAAVNELIATPTAAVLDGVTV